MGSLPQGSFGLAFVLDLCYVSILKSSLKVYWCELNGFLCPHKDLPAAMFSLGQKLTEADL